MNEIRETSLSMRTIRAFGPKDLRMVTIPRPIPGPYEVQVRVKVCGVCGSDKWFWNVNEASDYTAGHEACGEVSAVGPNCSWAKVGDRVAINNVKGCGHCHECQKGNYVRCPELIHMGQGFGEFLVAPERNLLALDPTIDWESAALIFDLWGTPYGALERLGDLKGKTVLVSGCGPIGLAAITLAKLRGAKTIAVDIIPERLEMARKLGAEATFIAGHGVAEEILLWTKGKGISTFLECSGKATSYELAWNVLAIGSTLVTIGEGALLRDLEPSKILIAKQLTWIGHLYSTMGQGLEVHNMMVRREFNPKAIVTHRYKLQDLPNTFGEIISGNHGILKTLVIID